MVMAGSGDGVFGYVMGTAFPTVHYGLRPNAPYGLVCIIFVSNISKTVMFGHLKYGIPTV
ncbi:hypothetical protein [Marinomonas epiphytica]